MNQINKVSIIGVGLMAGSLALALKDKFSHLTIVGFARSPETFRKLSKLGFLDMVEKDLENAVTDADLVIIGAPVFATIDYLKKISRFLKPGAIVCDLSSTKELVDSAAKKILPKNVSFVGCHPLCGSEKSGPEFSRKDLYKDSVCLITKQPGSQAGLVKGMWEEIGAKVVFIDSRKHDEILSAISHLPHLISFSLAASCNPKKALFNMRSFKDMTRVAGSPAQVWSDIFISNRKNLLKDCDKFIKLFDQLKSALKKQDKRKIEKIISLANRNIQGSINQ
jgi:prephenate dehydrogenase